MSKIRYAIIGSGWRAMFYVRIAKALPDQFEVTHLLCRTSEKKKNIEAEYDVPVTLKEKDIFTDEPDFVVVAVNKASIFEVSKQWMEYGYPVLCETPPATTIEQLEKLWQLTQLKEEECPISAITGKRASYKMQVAEQYFSYPKHAAQIALIQSGLIGEPVSMSISHVHDYHAISLIRRMLHTKNESAMVIGRSYSFPVTETHDRYVEFTTGKIVKKEHSILTLEYESGKMALYDFCGDQYHSTIRTRHILVRGTRGELCDDGVLFLNEEHVAQKGLIQYEIDEKTGEYLKITFQGQTIYEPPFGVCGLSDDETAIAVLLSGMKDYIDTGKEAYSFREGLSDAAFTIAMHEAGQKGWEKIPVYKGTWEA